jgi:hypothetical protein
MPGFAKVSKLELRQPNRGNFVRHGNVLAPLNMVIEKTNVSACWAVFLEVSSFYGAAARTADI